MSNVFSFTGKLGRDAEIRVIPNGGSVLNFTVANNVGFGENEKTIWVQCSVFGKRAEGPLVQYLTKGAGVFISGELSEYEYTGNDGIAKKSLRVNVNILELIDKKTGNSVEPQSKPKPLPHRMSDSNVAKQDNFNDDIPF